MNYKTKVSYEAVEMELSDLKDKFHSVKKERFRDQGVSLTLINFLYH